MTPEERAEWLCCALAIQPGHEAHTRGLLADALRKAAIDAVAADRVEKQLDAMTDEQRLEVFGRYCVHCGRKDPRCQCWSDE